MVKGRVGVAEVPHGEGASSVSLSAYWILSIAAGGPHIDIAYGFLRHCLSARMGQAADYGRRDRLPEIDMEGCGGESDDSAL